MAVHVLAFLAWRRGEAVTSERIAGSVNTNPVVVRRIVGALRNAGMVTVQPGVGGGAQLAREPERITLREVYRAVEDGESLFSLHQHPCGHCGIGANIREVLGGVFRRANDAMQGVLEEATVADVLRQVMEAGSACGAGVARR